MSDALKAEVLGRITTLTTVSLATCMDGQPHVRPMTMIRFRDRFYTVTGTRSEKVRQLAVNPRIEVCATFPEGDSQAFVRWQGAASIVTDTGLREAFHAGFDYIRFFWPEPDDPDLTVLEFTFATADYNPAHSYESTLFEW